MQATLWAVKECPRVPSNQLFTLTVMAMSSGGGGDEVLCGLTLAELAEMTGKTKQQVRADLKNLFRSGLIEKREPCDMEGVHPGHRPNVWRLRTEIKR